MTYKKKLIEVALPLVAISDASASEKTLKNSHPANLHQWWARRPLAAARAVLWSSLVDDPSARPEEFRTEEEQRLERKRLFSLLERLVQWDASDDHELVQEARREIEQSCDGGLPVIVDPFGGGGAIPLEALRLGLPTHSGDLNPVAILIQRAMLQAIPRFSSCDSVAPKDRMTLAGSERAGLSTDVLHYGNLLRSRVEHRVGSHYPAVGIDGARKAVPIAWIWARTVKSPDPAWPGHVPLVKSWVLAKRPKKPLIHLVPVVDHAERSIRFEIRTGGSPAAPTVERGRGVCLGTGAPIPADYIKSEGAAGRMRTVLLAVVVEGERTREYVLPNAEQLAAADVPEAPWHPAGLMSDHPQYMGTPRYGLDEWWKLYTPRQLLTLTAFVDELANIRSEVESAALAAGMADDRVPLVSGGRGATAYADTVAMFLMFAIDKLADLNNSLAAWEPIAQCPRHLFGRQAIQITWDYAEANPFSSSSGSFRTILDGICRTLSGRGFRCLSDREAEVHQMDAESRIAAAGRSVLSTDPPYYDNVPYSDLADFFYVWIRRGLASVCPDETATLLTPKADELVADHRRFGGKDAAREHFESRMSRFFAQVVQTQDARFPATLFYAFKAAEDGGEGRISTGWSTFLASIIRSGLMVTATWPMRTENKSRLRGLKSNALASSVILACRPRPADAIMGTRGDFVRQLRAEMPGAVRVLQEQNIAAVDLAQSSIGPGVAVFSRYKRVIEADGTDMSVSTALAIINDVLNEVLLGEESEFDADTRFALTWFEQFGHSPGPFGDADLLARAKDTTVAGVAQAGVVASRDGKVRLVERSELPSGWDPAADARLTVWETTQHLIRALDSSELEAAALLARLGEGLGERARQLAYLLYGICDRKKWAEEAGAYNMLVTAWPEISRLAASAPAPEAERSLF